MCPPTFPNFWKAFWCVNIVSYKISNKAILLSYKIATRNCSDRLYFPSVNEHNTISCSYLVLQNAKSKCCKTQVLQNAKSKVCSSKYPSGVYQRHKREPKLLVTPRLLDVMNIYTKASGTQHTATSKLLFITSSKQASKLQYCSNKENCNLQSVTLRAAVTR